jgi:RNA-directed DNA polymerase
VARLRRKVNEVLIPGDQGTWPEVRDRLNRLLLGWSNYFRYGTRLPAYRAVDNHVAARVRHFLRRRHGVPSRGRRVLADEVIFGRLGVLRLRSVHLGARP